MNARLLIVIRMGFHALVSGGFLVAYLSGDEDSYAMHQFAGYTVLAAIAVRLLLGTLVARGHPLALPWARPAEVGDWLRRLARADRGALLGRSPLHALLAGLLLAGVAAAALTGAVSDYTVVTEDLHEWLGEATPWLVGFHVVLVLGLQALRRTARRGGHPAGARLQPSGEGA